MKSIIIAGIILAASTVFAAEEKKFDLKPSASIEIIFPAIKIACVEVPKGEGRSGCCSHHEGVCGCSLGTVVCCDGSLSPSCSCHSDDVKSN